MGFARIYSGVLTAKNGYLNSTKDEITRMYINIIIIRSNIFRVRANKYVPINEASAGDIVAL